MSETSNNDTAETMISGGFFEFDDGGCYAGDWVNGQAYGYGKCTGPQGKGEYAGTWKTGFELYGVYTWPNGNTYAGEWSDGKRGGLGVETKGNWIYKGEWTQGLKGKYGVRLNLASEAKYEGSWSSGMQDGFGVETYIDESTYQGQWSKGMRHGFGIRKSVPRGIAAIYHNSNSSTRLRPSSSLPSGLSKKHTSSVSSQDGLYGSNLDNRKHDDSDRDKGGFVLMEKTKPTVPTHHSLQRSRSFSLSRTLSKRFKVKHSDGVSGARNLSPQNNVFSSDPSNLCGAADTGRSSLLACSVDVNLASVIEIYAGEWKNDKRCGFGTSQRSDGLSRYDGEWFNDRRCGYGVTVYKDGKREEGKYQNNELVSSLAHKRQIFTKKKFKDRVDDSVGLARKAVETANQKSELALAKRRAAISKGELAEEVANKASYFADIARKHAQKFEISLVITGFIIYITFALFYHLSKFLTKSKLPTRYFLSDPSPLGYDEVQERNITQVKSMKQIGRGESADSQISSWSGSSHQSNKKEQILQESTDDNVFVSSQINSKSLESASTQSKVKLHEEDSNRISFDSIINDTKSFSYRKQSSEDYEPQPKRSNRTTVPQIDKRDYFDDSPPEMSHKDETIPNGYLPYLFRTNNREELVERVDVQISKNYGFPQEVKICPEPSQNKSLKNGFYIQDASFHNSQINFPNLGNSVTGQNCASTANTSQHFQSVNTQDNQKGQEGDRAYSLRGRFSSDHQNRTRFTADDDPRNSSNTYSGTSISSPYRSNKIYQTRIELENKLLNSTRDYIGGGSKNQLIHINKNNSTPTLEKKTEQESKKLKNEPENQTPDLQSWLQQNFVTITFIIINFTFSALFFAFWSTKD